SGGWFSADKVRFRAGYPEKIGGWQRIVQSTYQGTCRALHQWSSVEFDFRYVALGTHLKLYVLWSNSYYDITPIRATFGAAPNPLPANPFMTSTAPNQVRVNVPNHGLTTPGEFVTFSGVAGNVDVYTPADLNQEFQVASVIDPNYFTIT